MMSSKKQSEARMSSSIRVFFSLAIAMAQPPARPSDPLIFRHLPSEGSTRPNNHQTLPGKRRRSTARWAAATIGASSRRQPSATRFRLVPAFPKTRPRRTRAEAVVGEAEEDEAGEVEEVVRRPTPPRRRSSPRLRSVWRPSPETPAASAASFLARA